jgi:hypothetical protein
MRNMTPWALAASATLIAGCVAAPAEPESPTPAAESAQTTPETEPAPLVAPAFDTPWPSGFTRRELADTALAKTFAFLDQRTEGASDQYLTIVYQDTVLEVHQEWGTDLAVVTIDAFGDYLTDDTLLVVGTDGDFLVSTLAELNKPLVPEFERCCSSGVAGVAHLGSSWVSLPSDFVVERMPPADVSAIIPHELFHNIQHSLDKAPASQNYPPGDALYRPTWLSEGSANYMGYAMLAYRGYKKYWGNHFIAPPNAAAEEDFLLSRYESSDGSNGPYSYGQLATEYIIANVGVEPLMNIWKIAGQGASFEDAFEEALGISVEDFYAAYDAMVESMVFD